MKKKILALILACVMLVLCACGEENRNNGNTPTITSMVTKDEKFGSAVFAVGPEDVEKAGFKLGDSCDIKFGNGYTLTDVPYYNGYYVKNNAPVFVAYPGFTEVRVTLNNMGIWDIAKLTDGTEVTVTLNTAGKYLPIQDSLGQIYSFDRNTYESDAQFANYRALSGGNLRPDWLFRGASPVDNSRGRATYVNALISESCVGFIIDLADSKEDIEGYYAEEGFASDYAKQLINTNQAVLLDMSSSYQSDEYKKAVADGLKAMISFKSVPVYIHCMEGKDRTGFVCMIIEAIAGASYDEMLNDYMITYQNYYSVSKEKTPEKYEAIAELYFMSFAEYLQATSDPEALKNANYVTAARNYLKDGGMTDDDIDILLSMITNAPVE